MSNNLLFICNLNFINNVDFNILKYDLKNKYNIFIVDKNTNIEYIRKKVPNNLNINSFSNNISQILSDVSPDTIIINLLLFKKEVINYVNNSHKTIKIFSNIHFDNFLEKKHMYFNPIR
jgi:hypothetical protein